VKSIKNVLSAIAGLAILALPAAALAHHDHDGDDGPRPYAWHDQGRHHGWFKHREQYGRPGEDEDDQGEHRRFRTERRAAFMCDGDGDDCEPNQRDWADKDYGPPISYSRAAPPASYNLVQERNWLLDRQRRAYSVLTQMRARHDRKAMRRISTVIHGLDTRIARDNQLLADRYPSAPVPNYPAQANPNYYSLSQANPYYPNYGYNPGYGYNPNMPASSGLNTLTNMVGPLLGLP
jgi:hypothetical protein